MAKNLPPNVKRNITDDEYITQIIYLLMRLKDHCDAIHDGALYRADDLAVVMRTLLGRGGGDDALAGMYRRLRHPQPTIQVSKPPASGADVYLSFGSVPRPTGSDSYDSLTFTELQDRLVVVTGTGERLRRRVVWKSLIEDLGNTWGAHLSSTMPYYLERVEVGSGDDNPLSIHLLTCLATAVHRAVVDFDWPHSDRFSHLPSPEYPESYVDGGTIELLSPPGQGRSINIVPRIDLTRRPPHNKMLLSTALEDGVMVIATWVEPDRMQIQVGDSVIVSDPADIGWVDSEPGGR